MIHLQYPSRFSPESDSRLSDSGVNLMVEQVSTGHRSYVHDFPRLCVKNKSYSRGPSSGFNVQDSSVDTTPYGLEELLCHTLTYLYSMPSLMSKRLSPPSIDWTVTDHNRIYNRRSGLWLGAVGDPRENRSQYIAVSSVYDQPSFANSLSAWGNPVQKTIGRKTSA